jgi:hypothetical protein
LLVTQAIHDTLNAMLNPISCKPISDLARGLFPANFGLSGLLLIYAVLGLMLEIRYFQLLMPMLSKPV